MMHKKDYLELADMIRKHNKHSQNGNDDPFTDSQLYALANFFQAQNPEFKRERWLDYVNGRTGPDGEEKK